MEAKCCLQKITICSQVREEDSIPVKITSVSAVDALLYNASIFIKILPVSVSLMEKVFFKDVAD